MRPAAPSAGESALPVASLLGSFLQYPACECPRALGLCRNHDIGLVPLVSCVALCRDINGYGVSGRRAVERNKWQDCASTAAAATARTCAAVVDVTTATCCSCSIGISGLVILNALGTWAGPVEVV